MRKLYTPLYRPPTMAALPRVGYTLIERGTAGHFPLRTDLPEGDTVHGVIAFDRPITDKEVADFELREVSR